MPSFLSDNELFYLNQTIADLYEEKDYEHAFHIFLEKLKEIVCFEKGDIYFYKAQEERLLFENFIFVDWCDRDLNSYLDRYCSIDDVLPIISQKQPLMFRSSDIFIASEREKTQYYSELLSPAGMQHSIEGNLFVNDDGNVGGIGIHRSDEHDDFSQKDLEILKLSRPHLSNVAKLYQMSLKEESHYLDIIPFFSKIANLGICIWDFDLNLLDSNLEQNEFVSPQHKEELIRGLMTLCKSLREHLVRTGIKARVEQNRVKSRVSIDRKSYFVDVTFSLMDARGKGRFVAVIYDYAGILAEILAEVKVKYALTNREYEVLQCMMNGMSNQAIANRLFISLPTVKKHLTSVYQKLNIEGKHQINKIL